MPDFGLANRLFPRADAIEEISHVIVAGVEARGNRGERFGEQCRVARFNFAARDKNPTAGPLESYAVRHLAGFRRAAHRAVGAVAGSALAGVLNAVGITVFDVIFGGRGEAAGNHLDERPALDRHRAAAFEAQPPKGNVVVVRAPVSHGAAGIVPPIPKRAVTTLADVRNERRLALPEIPVELGRHRRGTEWAFARTGRERRDDVLELPEAAVAHELASDAKSRVAPLLAASLENAVSLTRDGDE